ncbi:MAG TPA: TonB-dependent receptor, partial [Candidatus Baltobacteraceae bacterium]|nr:TonB-dependent receptor [Candidatus Baltobacteraceae bacterium]
MGILRRQQRVLRAAFTLLFLAIFMASSAGMALASNVGVLSGTVTDSANHAPLANVVVTAASGSGSYHATTNSRGFYSMTGVYADTYTVSFQLTGYEPVSAPGVSVFADQVATVNESLTKSLKTIATVRAHSASSAYQPNQTTDTVTVNAPQIQQMQGSAFNISETNLLTSLPGAMLDSSGYPVIHGGREYEEGFEFEGIPYTDAYSNQFNNSLAIPTAGISLVQLTPGAGDVNQGTGGGFGTFNVVAKRGTYPGYATLGASVGGPGFNHGLNFDDSWATPDGRWSNYLSTANANSTYQYGRNQYPYAQIGEFYNSRYEADREVLDNLVYRFGHNGSQSLQAFVDIAQHNFYQGGGGLLDQLCFASCDPVYTGTWSSIFGLTPGQITRISKLYPGQTQGVETLAQASNRAPFTYWQPNQAFKLEYTNALNSSTFLNITAYRTNSVVNFDGPSTEGSFYGDINLGQGGQTTGFTAAFQKQLSDKHLFEAGADVSHLHPVDSYLSDSFGLYSPYLAAINGFFDQYMLPYAFVSPSDPEGCTMQANFGVPNQCGYAYTANPGASQLQIPQFDQIATVNRQDYSAYISDKWTPNDRLNVQAAIRMDAATYRLPAPGIDPSTCTTLYLPTSWTPPTTFDAANNWACNAKATFNVSNDSVRPQVWQPRLGISYKLGSDTSIRLTYSRAVQFVPIADIDFGQIDPSAYLTAYGKLAPYDPLGAGTTSCGLATVVGGQSLSVPCRSFGEQLYWANQNFDGVAYQPARPTTSNNYQLTISHQFTSGILNGVAVSISPWYRKQYDTIAAESSPLLSTTGQPIVVNGQILFGPSLLTNNGKEQATGIDFNLTRQVANGLSGQLTASYINEFSSVIPLSSSEDFYPSIVPASVALGNMYRVGFVSPFQATLGLTYHTQSGWRINPRYTYNIGYPTGVGTITAADVNGQPYNLANTNVLPGSAPSG